MPREKGQKALRPFSRGTTSKKRAKVPFGPFRVAPCFKKRGQTALRPLMKFSKMVNIAPFDSKIGQNVDF